jgi:hypothetical protein
MRGCHLLLNTQTTKQDTFLPGYSRLGIEEKLLTRLLASKSKPKILFQNFQGLQHFFVIKRGFYSFSIPTVTFVIGSAEISLFDGIDCNDLY